MRLSIMMSLTLLMQRMSSAAAATSTTAFMIPSTVNPTTATAAAATITSAKAFHFGGVKERRRHFSTSKTALWDSNLPTMEELSTDPFMKQVNHASTLVPLLQSEKDNSDINLYPLLKAQLSHSDGIRGFFVSYLTGDGEEEEEFVVPKSLRRAMKNVDKKELVPLACMNVIMPTAMITMHTDPELSQQSSKTAKRGKVVLKTLLEDEAMGESDDFLVLDNCLAILEAATPASEGEEGLLEEDDDEEGEELEEEMIKYWQEFNEKWGYKETQLKDIVNAISEVIA